MTDNSSDTPGGIVFPPLVPLSVLVVAIRLNSVPALQDERFHVIFGDCEVEIQSVSLAALVEKSPSPFPTRHATAGNGILVEGSGNVSPLRYEACRQNRLSIKTRNLEVVRAPASLNPGEGIENSSNRPCRMGNQFCFIDLRPTEGRNGSTDSPAA